MRSRPDPSSLRRVNPRPSPGKGKIIVDATRQWPEEGGPEVYPELNRTLLEELAPDAFDKALAKWDDAINTWGKRDFV